MGSHGVVVKGAKWHTMLALPAVVVAPPAHADSAGHTEGHSHTDPDTHIGGRGCRGGAGWRDTAAHHQPGGNSHAISGV